MNSIIYKKALETINSRRLKARTENEKHIAEVERRIPEIAEINRMLAQTSIELFKIIREGHNVSQKMAALEKQNLQAQDMISRLLVENGYPHDYMDIRYSCAKCSDTGFCEGKACRCLDDLMGKLAVEELNSHSLIKLSSFETFDLSYYKGVKTADDSDCYTTMTNNYNYCKNYASTFSTDSKSVFIQGKTGLGKTHLSLAIANRVISMGWNVLYDSVINYLMQIEKEHFGRSDTDTDTLYTILNADLVILDDLGTEYDTSFYISTIYNIINTRLSKNLPTIISTNLEPEEIERKYEPRIVSRLFTMYEYLTFTGKDVRSIKAAENSQKTINMFSNR